MAELLEGLIPYSQRHFSRIDRLERSTFLLDYTLIGMSVIEPESDRGEIRNSSGKKVDTDDSSDDRAAGKEPVSEPTAETQQKKSSKKRKSKKSVEVCYKKVKLPGVEDSAVSLQA